MTKAWAEEILDWNYEPPYDFYNDNNKEESMKELLEAPYFAVLNDSGNLAGFYCIGYAAQVPLGYLFGAYQEDCVDIGLGMKPELTGKGNGGSFIRFVLEQVKGSKSIRLTVADFNERAITLYEKVGFQKTYMFAGEELNFIVMKKGPFN
ncbi:GNAT family N-acetyltransferase [Niallia circulans]|uniref:GNAT family N-acetyltransferase n=2 Tax=Niallia circulans TaxID=1397 RepID=A0A553SPY6_NIACI|nr:GNAT family N-acetyltransferase [Niallia circulans]